MAGGLLQIVSSGSADVFLTQSPQITFFKLVFMRHINFAIETMEEFFDGDANFGETVVCTLSKAGDLIHRMYLKVDLPEVLIPIPQTSSLHPANNAARIAALTAELDAARSTFSQLKAFMTNAFVLWRALWKELNSPAGNYETVSGIFESFRKSDNWIDYIKYNNAFSSVLDEVTNTNVNFDLVAMFDSTFRDAYKSSMFSAARNSEFKQAILAYLTLYRDQAAAYNRRLHTGILRLETRLQKEARDAYNFSWVRRVGLAMIEYVNIVIGGQVVDRLTADMLNVWYDVTVDTNQRKPFDRMIGDVPELYQHTVNRKPSFSLYIPLPFWFSRNQATALPAVSLRYHDVQVNLKLRDVARCCFFEPLEQRLPDDVNLAEAIRLANVSLYVDYVYVEQDERLKYGTRALEYLIEQHQVVTVSDVTSRRVNQPLPFTNPVKELFWVLQEEQTLRDFNHWHHYGLLRMYRVTAAQDAQGRTRLVVDNNGAEPAQVDVGARVRVLRSRFYDGEHAVLQVDNTGVVLDVPFEGDDGGVLEVVNDPAEEDTLETAQLVFNGIERIQARDGRYFNLVVPFRHHTAIPSAGVYAMTFALHPEAWQPSGACNMSLLSSNELFFVVSDLLFRRMQARGDRLVLKVFARSLNVLRITQGMASVEFGI
jgi:hypothetical protein